MITKLIKTGLVLFLSRLTDKPKNRTCDHPPTKVKKQSSKASHTSHGVFRWVKSWKLAVLPCTGMQAAVVVFCWDLRELTHVFCPHGWLLSILISVLKDHIRFLRCLNLYYVVTIYIGVYVSVFYFRFGNCLSRFSVKNSIFHQTVSVIAVCLVTEAV
jgi:hypothetical protein